MEGQLVLDELAEQGSTVEALLPEATQSTPHLQNA